MGLIGSGLQGFCVSPSPFGFELGWTWLGLGLEGLGTRVLQLVKIMSIMVSIIIIDTPL